MSLSPDMDNDRIWNLVAKKLAGEASAGELKELESALRLNPALHYSLEALMDMWRKNSEQEPGHAEAAFQKHLERMHSLGTDMGNPESGASMDVFPESVGSVRNWRRPALAITALFLITLGYYFFTGRHPEQPNQKSVWEVITRNGSKTNLLLPDGTTVWLNAGSRLTYDSFYGTHLREVTLSGEAYFEVAKNPEMPFIIHAGKINIKVLGTIFNVKSYPGEKTIETSLIKGSIEVSFPSQNSKKIILRPNQKLVIDKTDLVNASGANQTVAAPVPLMHIQRLSKVGTDSIFAETGWMQNRLYFSDMSFHELLKNMERKYGVSFHIADAVPDTIHFTGSFQNETVAQALEALRLTAEKSTANFSYEIQGNQVFINNGTTDVHSIQQ
ncbi:MAG: FecR family protein [Bacteroidota bacterium]|nr:FecR family protein [Bacteroidota bacterium]